MLKPPKSQGCLIHDIVVGDPVDGTRFRRNQNAWIEASDPLHDVALRRNPQDRHLDDTVLLRAQSGGLQVEKHEGPVERYG
jgi:hypothetical protein